MKNVFFKIIWNIIKFIFKFTIVSIILGYPTMILWNYTLSIIFMIPEISFIQAICLNLLSSILIKSNFNSNEKETPIRKFTKR